MFIIYNAAKVVPAAARRARTAAHAWFTARFAPSRPRMRAMLKAWARDAEALAAALDREHFMRLAEPGEAHAPFAAVHIRRARHIGQGVFECLVHPIPIGAMPLVAEDVGEGNAAEGFRRANRSARLERRALIMMERGRPRIMGLRVARPEAEPDACDVVQNWHRNGPGDRVDPAWLERAALCAGGVPQ